MKTFKQHLEEESAAVTNATGDGSNTATDQPTPLEKGKVVKRKDKEDKKEEE